MRLCFIKCFFLLHNAAVAILRTIYVCTASFLKKISTVALRNGERSFQGFAHAEEWREVIFKEIEPHNNLLK